MSKSKTTTQTNTNQSTSGGTDETKARATALWNLGMNDMKNGPQQYAGQLTSGLSPDQIAAANLIRGSGQVGQGAMGTGVDFATQAGQYTPDQVRAMMVKAGTAQGITPEMLQGFSTSAAAGNAAAGTASARDVGTRALTDVDLQGYMNPYTQNVVNSAMAEINQQQGQQNASLAAQQASRGAFGDSRSGIQAALQNQLFDQNRNSTASGLMQQNFLNAQQQAQTDLARDLQAQMSNQGADVSTGVANANNQTQASIANAGNQTQASISNQNSGLQAAQMMQQNNQFNANLGMQAGVANQNARLQAALANQGAGLQANQMKLGAAGTLGNLGMNQQQMYLNQANALGAVGQVAQNTQNAELAARYQKFLNEQTQGNQQMQNLAGIFSQTAPVSGMQSSGRQVQSVTEKQSMLPGLVGAAASIFGGPLGGAIAGGLGLGGRGSPASSMGGGSGNYFSLPGLNLGPQIGPFTGMQNNPFTFQPRVGGGF